MPPILPTAAAIQPSIQSEEQRACCNYVQAICETAYGLPPADQTTLAMWRLFDVQSPWSPVQACQVAGIADSITLPPAVAVPTVGRWHVCQGWRGTPGGQGITGHTWLWKALDATYGIRLDSAGQQFRPAPGPELHGLVKWSDQLAPYKYGVALAVLRPAR